MEPEMKNEYTWESVVDECEKILGCPDHATAPIYSDLPNLIRDLKNGTKYREHSKILVNVRWNDGYLEWFECSEVRFGSDLLWMRLNDGDNRHIPLRQIRWFSTNPESHGIR